MYRSSNSHYPSWSSNSSSHAVPTYPTSSPGPMPSAPHLRTVSLPHPNSAPHDHHGSPSSSSHYPSFEGSPRITTLHALLSWSGMPPLYFNVAHDVQYIRLKPDCSTRSLGAPAVNPPSRVLVLSLPSLPLWSTIEVRNENGVTVYDVLARIRDVLNRSVTHAEMEAMVRISNVRASEFFRVRTHADPRESAQGVKRIDFLGQNVFFAGLSRYLDGQDRWEVHLVPSA